MQLEYTGYLKGPSWETLTMSNIDGRWRTHMRNPLKKHLSLKQQQQLQQNYKNKTKNKKQRQHNKKKKLQSYEEAKRTQRKHHHHNMAK